MRLDDVIGGRWVVVHLGPASDCQAWRAAGVPVVKILVPGSKPNTDSVVDADGMLTRWLDRGAPRWWSCDPTGSSTPAPPKANRCQHPTGFKA